MMAAALGVSMATESGKYVSSRQVNEADRWNLDDCRPTAFYRSMHYVHCTVLLQFSCPSVCPSARNVDVLWPYKLG